MGRLKAQKAQASGGILDFESSKPKPTNADFIDTGFSQAQLIATENMEEVGFS
jgi:hypothetical protein